MNHDVSDEVYYQGLIRLHGKKILLTTAAIVIVALFIEARQKLINHNIGVAQSHFEEYLEKPSSAVTQTLQQKHPSSIQAQLVSLLEAKNYYEKDDYVRAESNLTFVINHSLNPDIKTIAASRLSTIYRGLGKHDKARQVFSTVEKHTAYSKYLEALAQPESSVERMSMLNEADNLNPTPYIHQLIVLAQYNNIGSL